MVSEKKRLFCTSCIAICLMFLLGCASSAQKRSDQDASLGDLAEQYWSKRLVEMDYKFTFNMELEKDSLSFSEYCERVKRSQRFNCSSVKIKEVIIKDDKGIVYLSLKCRMPFLPKPYALPINDVWLYESNRWKHKFTHK